MNLFQVASQDQSVAYLGQIFGFVGTVLQGQNGGSLLLGAMFKTLNTTALVLGALLVVHTTVVGLLKTAHEGEFLGKQWSSLWVPLRTVMGIAALFPTASGYSALQVVMMWVILQGVGAADTLWNTVINYVAQVGSPYAGLSLPTIGINNTLTKLFQGLVCEVSAQETDPIQTPTSNPTNYYYCAGGNCSYSGPSTNGIDTNLGPNGDCGSFSYCNQDALCAGSLSTSVQCYVCKAQVSAITQILATLRGQKGIAGIVESTDKDYLKFYENTQITPTTPAWIKGYCASLTPAIADENCCVYSYTPPPTTGWMPSSPDPSKCVNPVTAGGNPFPSDAASQAGSSDYWNAGDNAIKNVYLPFNLKPILGDQITFITAAVNYYNSSIGQAVTAWASQVPASLSDWQTDAENAGWILAGAYYYKIAQQNSSIDQSLINTVTSQFVVSPMATDSNPMASKRNNYSGTSSLLNAIQNGSNPNGAQYPPQVGAAAADFNGAANGLLVGLMNALDSGPNPISAIANFGQALLITAEVGYPVYIALVTILISVGTIDPMVLGSGITQNPVGPGLTAFFSIMTPLMLAFFAFCASFGSTLAVYVPCIPFIVFIMGAIGWLTATIEAMVAMPFVALGILSPGQSELLGRAEPSVMIMLNVFLRPTLMIFGMMAGMIMSVAVLEMINAGFREVLGSIAGGADDPISMIMFVVVYTMLVITALNKCFGLIYLIPERTLTWIGGQPISYGEAEGLAGVKAGAESASAAMGGAVGGSAKTLGGAGSTAGKGTEARAKAAGKLEEMKGPKGATLSTPSPEAAKPKEE